MELRLKAKASIKFSAKIANYKCFGPEPQGFQELYPINLVVGRNSAGKSSLLELIQYCCDGLANPPTEVFHRSSPPSLTCSMTLTEREIRSVFPSNVSAGGVPARNHYEYGARWIGAPITWIKQHTGEVEFVRVEPEMADLTNAAQRRDFGTALSQQADANQPLKGRLFRRLSAERNVLPEAERPTLGVAADGAGFTNLIHQILHDRAHPQEWVEVELLKELNLVFEPDQEFTSISARKQGQEWEVFLRDSAWNQNIALSRSGSGLKTVLLVLAFLHLLPKLERRPLKDFVFAFEELENNLHPAAQRRLLAYLREFVRKHDCTLFLTTHSSVAIDAFARDDIAQIVHVVQIAGLAKAGAVEAYVQHRGVLDDLDVRASDLLQANGLIWVEGPSDRVYVNRWIELWSGGALRDGLHYQVVFYGGRLLSHLTADVEDEHKTLINVLTINRNAAVLIDSDKSSAADAINETKKRIETEFRSIDAIVWITEGREIENYLHPEVVSAAIGSEATLTALDPFEDFARQLDGCSEGAGKRFERSKSDFAERAAQHISRQHLNVLDLGARLDALCRTIEKWNKSAN